MGALEGRTVAVTGAGRGLGREHALLLAAEGARVVVNDVGGSSDGSGADATPAYEVVELIRAQGGEAVAHTDDISSPEGAQTLVDAALDSFGELHALVNNAGILRDRTLVNMSDEDWDSVLRVHLRGHFMPLRAAARHWRARSKQGRPVSAAVVNTASTSGLFGQVGQANYGAAKAGIASLTTIAQLELASYGVRVNAVCPAARTRLTEGLTPAAEGHFDPTDPANVSPFVAYLVTQDCPLSGRVFFVMGAEVHLLRPWSTADKISTSGRWSVAELAEHAPVLATADLGVRLPY